MSSGGFGRQLKSPAPKTQAGKEAKAYEICRHCLYTVLCPVAFRKQVILA
jgi:hypothetical protein